MRFALVGIKIIIILFFFTIYALIIQHVHSPMLLWPSWRPKLNEVSLLVLCHHSSPTGNTVTAVCQEPMFSLNLCLLENIKIMS